MSAHGDRCVRIRPLIGSLAEGELAPDEAMRVARHLPDCTACRIIAARERRLARMLEEDLDDLPVGEEFVRTVMSTLPDGPPPPPTKSDRAARRWKTRRGLKLAGLFGMLAGAGWTLWQQAVVQGALARPALPTFSLEQSEGYLQAVAALIGVVLGFVRMTLATLADLANVTGGWVVDLSAYALAVATFAAVAGVVLFATATLSTLVLFGARLLVQPATART